MNILKLLDTFNFGDNSPKLDQPASRRESLSFFGDIGAKVALAAIPAVVLAALPKNSFARTMDIPGVLNFALTLEFLEKEYYTRGVASGVIPSADLAIFQQIKKHEVAHVTFLQDAITSVGGTPVAEPMFDFTAGGNFSPFSMYGDFLALAQAFEDTGVRAYKGQAGNLMASDAVLNAALRIHSVEARHASQVRRLRMSLGQDPNAKGWISGNDRGTLPSPTQPVYDGEENVMQGGVDATTVTTASAASVREAFDEPLDEATVSTIAGLFIM